MTRLTKGPGTAALRREYIYSDPPLSISDLAEKYDLARSNVAQKATDGRWFEEREAFRAKLEGKVAEALAEKWVEAEIAFREKMLQSGSKYLDRWIAELEKEGSTIKANTRDMLGIAGMMRTLLVDVRKEATPATVLVDAETGEVSFADPAEAKKALEKAKMMLLASGAEDDDEAEAV